MFLLCLFGGLGFSCLTSCPVFLKIGDYVVLVSRPLELFSEKFDLVNEILEHARLIN